MDKELINREANVAAELCGIDQTNIVPTFGHGDLLYNHRPLSFIDMELCDLTLKDYMDRHWPAPPRDNETIFSPQETVDLAWIVMRDITAGLKSIHDARHVHRDLKPENGLLFYHYC
jgi:serine/threonine protein kinase